MSTFTPTGSTGGAFETTAGDFAIGRSAITGMVAATEASFRFNIARRGLFVRVGSTAGAQDIVNDVYLEPGDHLMTFAPGAATCYIEFQLREVGNATLSGFARVAAGDMSLPTPWPDTSLRPLRSEQSLDVQYWFHPLYEPCALERRGAKTWSLRKFRPRNGPFEPNETSGYTLTPSVRSGTAVITASGPVFSSVDAGSLLRLTQVGQYQTATGDNAGDVTSSIRVAGEGEARRFQWSVSGTFSATIHLERSTDGEASWALVSTTTTATSTPLLDGLDNQIAYYRLRVEAYTSGAATMELIYSGGVTDGYARIFSVNADDEVTVDVLRPFATTSATSEWARGSWSNRYGWPAVGMLFDGRMHIMRAARRWHSAADDFENFVVGPDDADAISGTIPGQMSGARWMKAGARPYFGTAGAEGDMRSGADDDFMTPDNSRARIRSSKGSGLADAVLTDTATPLFVHRSGRKLIALIEGGDTLTPLELTRLNRNAAGAGSGTFVELAWQTEPEPRIWAVRSDGQLSVMLLNEQEQISAFTRIAPVGTNAAYESVCILPGTPEDAVYAIGKRTIGGVTRRFIEKLAVERWDETNPSAAWRLQAAALYSGASTTVLSGLIHLEGEAVHVWGNGRVQGPFTVSSGSITLDYAVTYAIAGLKYVGQYKGTRLIGALTKNERINRIGLLVHNTPKGLIGWGKSLDAISDNLPDRSSTGAYDSPLELVSDDLEFPFEGETRRDARCCIQFNGVGPAAVLGLAISREKNQR